MEGESQTAVSVTNIEIKTLRNCSSEILEHFYMLEFGQLGRLSRVKGLLTP